MSETFDEIDAGNFRRFQGVKVVKAKEINGELLRCSVDYRYSLRMALKRSTRLGNTLLCYILYSVMIKLRYATLFRMDRDVETEEKH